jgi:hypothetical protein
MDLVLVRDTLPACRVSLDAQDARMNALKTYWLCRTAGAATEGPFTFGELKRQMASGTITAGALVCRQGEEEWTGIEDEMLNIEMEAAPVLKSAPPTISGKAVRKRMGYGGCALLIFSLIAGVFNPFLGVGLFFLALIVDFTAVKTVCSVCGNQVVKTSRECPACRAKLK